MVSSSGELPTRIFENGSLSRDMFGVHLRIDHAHVWDDLPHRYPCCMGRTSANKLRHYANRV